MGRKPGLSGEKMGRIISVLLAYPDGIWLRDLARKCKYTHSTVSRYLNTALKLLVIDEPVGNPEKPALRLVKIKPFVFDRLQEGKSIDQILKTLKMIESIG